MINSRVLEILDMYFYRTNIELNFNILTPNCFKGKELICVKNNLDAFVCYTVLEKFC